MTVALIADDIVLIAELPEPLNNLGGAEKSEPEYLYLLVIHHSVSSAVHQELRAWLLLVGNLSVCGINGPGE